MVSFLAILKWIVNNWQLLATLFSSVMSVMLFFLHGNAKSDITELQQFINSLQISKTGSDSAQQVAEMKNPRI